jgi:hypothetical protein
MGNDESQQKPADFHHPVSPEILQAVIDTGGVTDGSIIPLLEGLSPLEMRINLTVRKWKPAYTAFAEARKRTGSKRQRKKEIDAIAKAERILAHWLPFLSADGLNPGNVSSIIAGGKWSEWLKQWPSQAGRPSEFILAECAEDLAKVFKREGYRKPPWEEIGNIISDKILDADGLHKGDLGNWILNLVKRHRRQQEIDSSKSRRQ